MEWIRIEDKLPPESEHILMYTDNGEVFCGRVLIDEGYIRRVFYTTGHLTWDGVTHWMPLPPPPSKN